MKTFQIKILLEKDAVSVENLLKDLAQKEIIEFSENTSDAAEEKPHYPSENQVQEIIEESEIGPYYSDNEAKDILNI